MKFSYDWIVSVILVPKTAVYCILRPRLIARQAFDLNNDKWGNNQAPFGIILAFQLLLLALYLADLIVPNPGILKDAAQNGLEGQITALKKLMVLPTLIATVVLGALVFTVSALGLLLSWRPLTRNAATRAVRAAILMLIPGFVLSVIRAGNWFTFRITDSSVLTRVKEIISDDIISANKFELAAELAKQWQVWASLWPL